jgi:predicted phage terminase large subunit-like protein
VARSRGYELLGHPLDIDQDGWEPPVAVEQPQPAQEDAPPPAPKFAGLRQYCETVTPSWDWSWRHLVAIDTALDAVRRGEIKKVIIQMPTRIGKTEKTTVRFPALWLEEHRTDNIIVTGYNDKFAARLSRKIQRIVRGRLQLSLEKKGAHEWETIEGGGVIAGGVGVGVAGLPANLIMVDDPTKNRQDAYSQAHRDMVWEWFTEDIITRLEPEGAIVVTAARRHEDDLIGRILASEDGPNWTVLRLPALAEEDNSDHEARYGIHRAEGEALCPQRFDEAAYARMKRLQGEAAFNALQQQRPAPASGLIFNTDWVRYYTVPEHPIVEKGHAVPILYDGPFDSQLQSWDMTFKDNDGTDFVVGQAWKRRGANCYLMPLRERDRMNFPATLAAVRRFTLRYPTTRTKLVEDKANGPAIIASLKSEITGMTPVEPKGDKMARAHSTTHMWSGGNVWLPHPAIAPWVKGYILEHLQFPFGVHDDDVDATSQALSHFQDEIDLEAKRRAFAARQAPSRSLINTRM